ncbi:hypothetical protein ABZP36_014712 [Zizania latifolia]
MSRRSSMRRKWGRSSTGRVGTGLCTASEQEECTRRSRRYVTCAICLGAGRMVGEEPTSLKAAWELLEIFFIDKQLQSWLPECLVDWLADYDSLLTKTENTVYCTLSNFQKRLINLQSIYLCPVVN